jgi:hypothetical protein
MPVFSKERDTELGCFFRWGCGRRLVTKAVLLSSALWSGHSHLCVRGDPLSIVVKGQEKQQHRCQVIAKTELQRQEGASGGCAPGRCWSRVHRAGKAVVSSPRHWHRACPTVIQGALSFQTAYSIVIIILWIEIFSSRLLLFLPLLFILGLVIFILLINFLWVYVCLPT